MRKAILFFFCLISFLSNIHSQEVISTQGDSYITSLAILDFTIGEPVISTLENTENDLTQGFHQPLLIINNIINIDNGPVLRIFPNPTSQVVTVEVDSPEEIVFYLYDVNGKLLKEIDVETSLTYIDLSPFTSAVYILVVQEPNKIRSFQILKQR